MNLEQNILQIPIGDIIPNRFQPRLNFEDRGLEELANSIKQHGIIQPLVLRRVGDKFEIIAGERRFKAANMAGLKTVPGVIAQIDDNKSAEVAIVENVQRRDLSAIEEARSYKNLLDKGYLTQTELAKKMGISQSAIANKLRLLNLAPEVQEALLNNEISERHARSLLVLPTRELQKEWLNKIIKERLTVRELDEALKKLNSDEDEEGSDIPLVKPVDIETIRKEATELPNVNDDNEIARKIAEIEREKMFNPDIIPVDQASNNSKSNFFNFLENETVNMNTEEQHLVSPPIDLNLIPDFNNEPKKEEAPQIPQPEEALPNMAESPEITAPSAPPLTEPAPPAVELTPSPVELKPEAPVEPAVIEPLSPPEPILNPNFGTPEVLNEASNDSDFDPVRLIDTLDPKFEEKLEEKLGIDLKSAINIIRDTKTELETKGFNITMEETDLKDIYQFIIKIKKN